MAGKSQLSQLFYLFVQWEGVIEDSCLRLPEFLIHVRWSDQLSPTEGISASNMYHRYRCAQMHVTDLPS